MADTNVEADLVLLSPTECPVKNITDMNDVLKLGRSKAIVNAPQAFASCAVDPENGALNVREFLENTIMFTDGEAHRVRRRTLNRLIQPSSLDAIREDVVRTAGVLLERMVAEPGPDGTYRMDLVEFLERVFLHFTARFIGLVGVDTDEGLTRLRSCAGALSAGTSSAFLEDRATILEWALEAKRRYVTEFFEPSRAAMQQALAEVEAGTL